MPDLTKMSVEELVNYTHLPMSMRIYKHDAIIAELTRRTDVPKGHVKLDDGRVVKVLGTLPMTKDGCVVGNHTTLWINDIGEVSSLRVDNIGCSERDGCDEAFWEAGECYSTREAALAAKGVERE